MPTAEKTKLTPPEVARRWGVAAEKVVRWIKSGELRAINAASTPNGKPRFLIDAADLAAFENRRAFDATPKPKRRRKSGDGVIDFF